ncbi:MAG: U32 family peptidase [Rikenellaceae bacterium]|nr:U32 family peptidase [Rikenellaceae bacterium]
MKRRDIEIMAPVGSYESLNAAIAAGADSVYFGVEQLNMRAASSVNFTLDDLAEIVRTAHAAGVKTYLTVNIVIYDDEMEVMRRIIDRAKAEGIDAIIATDLAAILYARQVGIEVHISTQSNISNITAVKFFSQWADVVVLARELSLEQIAAISRQIADEHICGPAGELVKIEMFAHGAMCMSMSGKCYLSEHESHNSANRGACRQICRRKYTITDKDSGQQLDIDGQYVLSPKDLCTIDFLDTFINAGVRVLKIEGRARGGEYVKRVVEAYNEALMLLERGEFSPESVAPLKERLRTVFNRDFWGGYYAAKTMVEHSQHYGSSATLKKVYMGKVTNYFKRIGVAEVLVEACELNEGDALLFMGEKSGVVEQSAEGIMVCEKPATVAKQGEYVSLKTVQEVRRGDKVYKEVPR